MSNHCRHCDRCRDIWLGAHTNAKGATWPDGHCPACAEAERIAAAIEAKRAHPINEGKDAYDCAPDPTATPGFWARIKEAVL